MQLINCFKSDSDLSLKSARSVFSKHLHLNHFIHFNTFFQFCIDCLNSLAAHLEIQISKDSKN